MWHLLKAYQQESFLLFSSWQSLSCCLSRVAKRSTLKLHNPLLFTPLKLHDALPSSPKPPGPLSSPSEPRGPLSLWLPHLGLNPRAHLPLKPYFRLLLQLVTPTSIHLFFQLYWAAIVSPSRCGPMVWSQSSSSSHTGAVTRGSCFPVTSWVEVTPTPVAQSMATAISHIYETS